MIRRLRLSTLLFYGLTALMVVASVISFANAVSWISRPFPGFMVYHPPHVGFFSSRDWPGKKAGLIYLDRIVAVDGRPVRYGQDVIDTVRQK